MITEPPGSGFHDEDAAWEALARRVAGEPPAEDGPPDAALDAWLESDPGRAALARLLERSRVAPAADLADEQVEAALRAVKRRMAAPPVLRVERGGASDAPVRRPVAYTRRWSAALSIAAALVLVLAAGLLFRRFAAGRGAAGADVYATAVGERQRVRLADGTDVLLGPASRLAVAQGYGGDARAVELSGEALFDVRHDDAHPFRVRAAGAVIRDLGTRFTVATDGAGVRVSVAEGRVRVQAVGSGADTGVILERGDAGTVRAEGAPRATRGGASGEDLAWTRGRLVFRDASFDLVADRIRRWYGVRLRAGDPAVAGRRLTASFEGDPVREVLDVVALALGAEVTMRGDTAVLRSVRRAPP